jgi:fumarate reductase flavoprotein subunit
MRQTDTQKAALIFYVALFLMTLATGCETPAGSEESYTLHFTAGTYEASATGFNTETPIAVQALFSEDAIEEIVIVSHGEGVTDAARDRYNAPYHAEQPPLDEDALIAKVEATLDGVSKAIVRDQTLVPDAISGATAIWTREGILKAVEDCVKQAGGDEAVAKLKEGGAAQSIVIMF